MIHLCFVFFLSDIPNEQEEPDSAFEATQYFFEDITPETSMGNLTSRDKINTPLQHACRRETTDLIEENVLLHSLIQEIGVS